MKSRFGAVVAVSSVLALAPLLSFSFVLGTGSQANVVWGGTTGDVIPPKLYTSVSEAATDIFGSTVTVSSVDSTSGISASSLSSSAKASFANVSGTLIVLVNNGSGTVYSATCQDSSVNTATASTTSSAVIASTDTLVLRTNTDGSTALIASMKLPGETVYSYRCIWGVAGTSYTDTNLTLQLPPSAPATGGGGN